MTGLSRYYIRHPDGRIEPCFDVDEFKKWKADVSARLIERTAVPYGPEDREAAIVVTLFTGVDVPFTNEGDPLLFETATETPEGTRLKERYQTEEEARAGHARMVRRIQALVGFEEERRHLPSDADLTDGLKDVFHGPPPAPPKLKRIKQPEQKDPDPTCRLCRGEGRLINDFGLDVICDCTIVRRK